MKTATRFCTGASACAVSLLLAATPAHAMTYNHRSLSDWYFGASGDLTWLRHSKTGGGGNIDLGYRFMPSNFGDWRIEAEAGYHGAGGDHGNGSTHYFTYMGNLAYDFNTVFTPSSSGWHVVPYIGAGLGDAAVHLGSTNFVNTFHHHSNNFAYQGLAGLSFVSASMPATDWSIGYRYLGTDDHNLHSNSLELGVRFHF